jgi:alanine racemase
MDQFVVDLGALNQPGQPGEPGEPSGSGERAPAAGEPVVLFGPGTAGEPTAQDWADACGTISYEIVTRIGGRMQRRYVGERS